MTPGNQHMHMLDNWSCVSWWRSMPRRCSTTKAYQEAQGISNYLPWHEPPCRSCVRHRGSQCYTNHVEGHRNETQHHWQRQGVVHVSVQSVIALSRLTLGERHSQDAVSAKQHGVEH